MTTTAYDTTPTDPRPRDMARYKRRTERRSADVVRQRNAEAARVALSILTPGDAHAVAAAFVDFDAFDPEPESRMWAAFARDNAMEDNPRVTRRELRERGCYA